MSINPNRKTEMIQTLERALAIVSELPVVTRCHECINFREGFCEIHNADVPPDWQDAGCSEWSEQIPF